jgi:hypothetical protein
MRRAVVTILLVFTAFTANSQETHIEQKPFANLVERVLHGLGQDAHLPPNISQELGLTSQFEMVNVKQIAFHLNEKEIIAFNVCIQSRRDIVIFRITDTAWVYYLTSPDGVLRKAKYFEKSSAGSSEFYPRGISSLRARDGFKREKQCWLDVAKTSRLAPACTLADK